MPTSRALGRIDCGLLLISLACGPYTCCSRGLLDEADGGCNGEGLALIQRHLRHSNAGSLHATSNARLSFEPFSLDGMFVDGFDPRDRPPQQQELLEASPPTTVTPSESPNGVLCQTLLHSSVHDKHFMSYAKQGLGGALADKFDGELQRKCKEAYTPDAWAHLWDSYTGKWSQDAVTPSDNVIFGSMGAWLNEERTKSGVKAATWDDFRNRDDEPDDSGMEDLLRHVANSSSPATSLHRILDFGCGDGVELSKIARGLGLSQGDTLCLDIVDYVAEKARPNVTFLLAPDGVPEYENALQEHLETKQLRGTVSAVFSLVTFHHITKPEIRVAALNFIRESLAPDGFFLLAEWDNVVIPIDFTIYFDIAHFLPQWFFMDPAPTTATLGPLSTEYLSVQGWKEMMKSNGLPFNSIRSRLPWRAKKDNATVWLDPEEAAHQASGRNFLAVFAK